MTELVPQVAIVDYGLGNLFSVKNACEHVGLRATITSSRTDILTAGAVLLPGVGAFGDAMQTLHKLDLVTVLHDVAASGKPLIGVCLGIQLLMTESYEFGRHKGLGLVEGDVMRLDEPEEDGRALKIPQIGWNRIRATGNWAGSLLEDVENDSYMYFVHSFVARPQDREVVLSNSNYGDFEFCSSLKKGNIFACQFHPERSGRQGLKLYQKIAQLIELNGRKPFHE